MNTKEITQLLANVDLFGGLSKRALGQVASSGRLTEHESGHEVIAEGSGAVGFHLIVSGKARVTTGETVRRTLGVGDYFGEISVIDGKPRSASVEADGPLQTFMIRPSTVRALIADNPKFTMHLLETLCQQIRDATRT